MNAITWFEIPTTDLDRAAKFWGTVLGKELRRDLFGGTPHAFFPGGERKEGKRDDVAGALIFDAKRKPAATGTMVYVNGGTPKNLDDVLARVAPAGGKILLEKTDIGDPGFIAVVVDSEGNHVGLHAEKNA